MMAAVGELLIVDDTAAGVVTSADTARAVAGGDGNHRSDQWGVVVVLMRWIMRVAHGFGLALPCRFASLLVSDDDELKV